MNEFLVLEAQFKRVNGTSNVTDPEYLSIESKYVDSYHELLGPAQIFFRKVMIVSYLSFLPLFYGI